MIKTKKYLRCVIIIVVFLSFNVLPGFTQEQVSKLRSVNDIMQQQKYSLQNLKVAIRNMRNALKLQKEKVKQNQRKMRENRAKAKEAHDSL